MTAKALTAIHFTSDDGERYRVEAGEAVDKGKFSDAQWGSLLANGAVEEDAPKAKATKEG